MISKKIIIGSANVNIGYGLKKNRINEKEFNKLMNFAYSKGVKTIDTSPLYKDSEKIIGLSKKNFNVITKIPKIPLNLKTYEIENWIKKKIINSQKKLKKKIYGILIQNIETLTIYKVQIVLNALLNLKKKRFFKKIGISIYKLKILRIILKPNIIDFVQLPYNFFDQNISKKKAISDLKKKNIEIHVRSIFLQGLLLKKKLNLPKKLKKLYNLIIRWQIWLKKNKIDPVDACLACVLQNKDIDKLVIGFDTIDNFNDVINFKKPKINMNNFKVKINQNLLDPRKWS